MDFKKETSKLIAIKKAIETKKYSNDLSKVIVLAEELYQTIYKSNFKYMVEYTNKENRVHKEAFFAYGKQYKNQALCDLWELGSLLKNAGINKVRCLVLVNNLIDSVFYTKTVQAKISKWLTLSNRNAVKTESILV